MSEKPKTGEQLADNTAEIMERKKKLASRIDVLSIRLERMGRLEFPGLNQESIDALKAEEIPGYGPTTDEFIVSCQAQGICIKMSPPPGRNITVCPAESTDPMMFCRLKHLDADSTDDPILKVAILSSQEYAKLVKG